MLYSTARLVMAGASLFAFATPALAGNALAPAPAALKSAPAPASPLDAARLAKAPSDLRSYYAYYGTQPLWIGADGRLDPAARALLQLVQTADFDALDPAKLGADELAAAIARADSQPTREALTDAEVQLSKSLVAYETALRSRQGSDMTYEHANLQPFAANAQSILRDAATSGSLNDYVTQMKWMHPLYAPLRASLAAGVPLSERDVVVKNLERLRDIPRAPGARYILVDTASARLFMYEGDKVVDTMKVVVGKPEMPTPALAGYVRYATFNPYWYVPSDIIPNKIAPNVLKQGPAYLKRQGYSVVADYSADAPAIDPKTIDWKAVADRKVQIKLRQNPGGANAMGKVKYEFPNAFGIYLHDTPEKELLAKDGRQFSSGCIRLEDASRLGRWLLGGALPAVGTAPEQRVDLAQPVPVYVTYLTARAENGQIALGPDPYGRDKRAGGQGTALAMKSE